MQAAVHLMQAAMKAPADVRRFVPISGSCYPIRSNRALPDFLFTGDSEFISTIRVPNVEEDKPLEGFTRWYFEGGERVAGLKAKGIRIANRILALFPYREFNRRLEGLPPYCGSQWWCLSRHAVAYVLGFVERKAKIVEFFQLFAQRDTGERTYFFAREFSSQNIDLLEQIDILRTQIDSPISAASARL